MEPTDQNMESVIRGWIGEPRLGDQRGIGELTAQVQRLQQVRGTAAETAVTQPATNRLGKPPVFRGEETKWQEWYFKFREYIMCSGDKYPELVTAIEDPAQGPMDTTRWDAEQIQVSRHLILVVLMEESALRLLHRRYNPLTQGRMSSKLNEVLQVDLGANEKNEHGQRCSVGTADSRVRDNVEGNVSRRRKESNHHGEVTIGNQNVSVGQCPNLDEMCDSACGP